MKPIFKGEAQVFLSWDGSEGMTMDEVLAPGMVTLMMFIPADHSIEALLADPKIQGAYETKTPVILDFETEAMAMEFNARIRPS